MARVLFRGTYPRRRKRWRRAELEGLVMGFGVGVIAGLMAVAAGALMVTCR
jgi:uncharacterized membrane protein YfcA